jgi:hypothetical protein
MIGLLPASVDGEFVAALSGAEDAVDEVTAPPWGRSKAPWKRPEPSPNDDEPVASTWMLAPAFAPGDEDDEDDDDGFWPGGSVYVAHTDGIRTWEVARLDEGRPHHLEWSPDSLILLLLLQEGDHLVLDAVDPSSPQRRRRVAEGLPIFWGWQPGGSRLALHLTDPTTGASAVRFQDLEGGIPRTVEAPGGNFYAPAWRPDGGCVAVSLRRDEQDLVVLLDEDGDLERELFPHPGRAAFGWRADGKLLAVAIAPEAEGPFDRLHVVDLETDTARSFEFDFVLFRWRAEGDLLVALAAGEALQWGVLRLDGGLDQIGDPWVPTQEVRVALHFFEEVGRSQPFLSADSRFVVHAGQPRRELGEGDDGELPDPPDPRITVTNLDVGAVVELGPGRYACFAPPGGPT